MRKWRWVASVSLSLIIAFFIIAAFIYTPEQEDKNQNQPPATEEAAETNQTDQEQNEPAEDPQEEMDTEESADTLSDGLRDVFTSVIESARHFLVKDDIQIVAVGDSLTQGVGDSTENGGYVGILEETFNSNKEAETINIANYGKRGNRTDQLLERLENEEISNSLRSADLVLLTIGANDVMKVVENNFTSLNYQDFVQEQEGYEERLHLIIQKVRALNQDAPIYLLGLYNPFDKYFNNIPELGQIMGDWNAISKQVIDNYDNATFIPIRDLFEGSEEELLWEEDNFHPNERGYKLMAERVLEYIREDIEQ
ncbi:SGNH/GDSL hydrolase family protein [Halobacillus litoralis]|uniref:SGNH/GDSL hydrolase family protein n=1 Tax=Halobacillus litoralis TaxID=45668 RepID=UPI00249095CC|nr:SGNH/GDSL hydrolase family protein [Halobacillus litoralis]